MPLDQTYLQVSDGTGDAALMHVTNDRTPGSTVVEVDTLVGVPQKFIATSGTPEPTGFIDPTTARNFYGHINGSNLEIEGFLPGSVDDGNVEGQIVVIKPNSFWANMIAEIAQEQAGNTDALLSGLVPMNVVGTYVSAFVMTLPGDWTAQLAKDDFMRFTNTTTKWFRVKDLSFGSGVTTVTFYNIKANAVTVYQLANAAITSVYFSKADHPGGLPDSLNSKNYRCRAYLNSSQLPASGGVTKVLHDAETYDPNQNFASSRYNVPMAGSYLVTHTVTIAGSATNQRIIAYVYKNGANYGNNAMSTGVSTNNSATAVDIVQCADGDYIEGYVYQDGGVKSLANSTNETYLSIQFLSPV